MYAMLLTLTIGFGIIAGLMKQLLRKISKFVTGMKVSGHLNPIFNFIEVKAIVFPYILQRVG